jgi:hypothetical protein
VTGYWAETEDEFARQVLRSFSLDRTRVRRQAEERFSARQMARSYSELYQRVVGKSPGGTGTWQP